MRDAMAACSSARSARRAQLASSPSERRQLRPRRCTVSSAPPPVKPPRRLPLRPRSARTRPVPSRRHPYLLRSCSPLDPPAAAFLPGLPLQSKRSSTSSRDSGIDSATSTSDSEDSNASGSEASIAASRSIPVSDVHGTTSIVPVINISTSNTITAEIPNEPMYESTTTTTLTCSFTVVDNFVTCEREDIPAFLQDIDDVISADSQDEAQMAGLPDLHCHSLLNDSTTSLTAAVTQEVLVQQETAQTAAEGGQVVRTTNRITTTYLYTASAGELEFVTEIFRSVQRVGPSTRVPAVLPPKTRSCPKFTLVLDLDETLVHCFTNDPPAKYDHYFTVQVPDMSGVTGIDTQLAVFARLRPYVKEFLTRMASRFEVVVFTASMKNYSSKMLDLLDPDGSLIKYRFYRDHCVPVGCSFVKDLSIFTRDLSKLIIVDNQIASFAFQIENGIPIRSWIGDDADRELLALADFLENIAQDESIDVRNIIRDALRIPAQLQSHVDMYYSSHLTSPVWSLPTVAPVSAPIFACTPAPVEAPGTP